jgi:hypothetical protein
MRRPERVLGWILLVLAALLSPLGVLCWPPGGLMFALPFIFLIPASSSGPLELCFYGMEVVALLDLHLNLTTRSHIAPLSGRSTTIDWRRS